MLRLVRLGRRELGEDLLGLDVHGVVRLPRLGANRRQVRAEVLALLGGELREDLLEVEHANLHRFAVHRALSLTLRGHARRVVAPRPGKRSDGHAKGNDADVT